MNADARRRKKRRENMDDESDLDDRLDDGFEMLDENDHDDPLPPQVTQRDEP